MKQMRLYIFICIMTVLVCSNSIAETIDECGTLQTYGGCILFKSFASGQLYILDNYSFHKPFIRVSGEAIPQTTICEKYTFTLKIPNNQIVDCIPEDLGCGVLSGPFMNCWLWTSSIYGELLVTPPVSYSSGDTVRVYGILNYYSTPTCLMGDGTVYDDLKYPCQDSTTSIEESSWGVIKSIYYK
nr:hypothetical protein [uncultured bacterium]BAJ06936.1 hypothetical protein [uncultured bacterium]